MNKRNAVWLQNWLKSICSDRLFAHLHHESFVWEINCFITTLRLFIHSLSILFISIVVFSNHFSSTQIAIVIYIAIHGQILFENKQNKKKTASNYSIAAAAVVPVFTKNLNLDYGENSLIQIRSMYEWFSMNYDVW